MVVKQCLKFGPAPVNLNDTVGRYMWTICEIGNTEPYQEKVTISATVTGVPPNCTGGNPQLILPGLPTFFLAPSEQKWVLYRDKYTCTLSATPGTYPLNVKFCVNPQPTDGGDGPTVCHEQTKSLIVHNPAP
jgi:hypothetical protein